MAKFSLRRYEDQALASVVLAAVAVLGLIPLTVIVFRHFNAEQRWIMYNPRTVRLISVLAFAAFSGGFGFLGFVLGINSAGQRRNTRQGLSWLGFALGAGGMLLALLLLACFWLLKQPISS